VQAGAQVVLRSLQIEHHGRVAGDHLPSAASTHQLQASRPVDELRRPDQQLAARQPELALDKQQDALPQLRRELRFEPQRPAKDAHRGKRQEAALVEGLDHGQGRAGAGDQGPAHPASFERRQGLAIGPGLLQAGKTGRSEMPIPLGRRASVPGHLEAIE
jgi:hypothetical protein